MMMFFLTQTTNQEQGIPYSILMLIIMLCMFIPYFLRKSTGKGVGEWLSGLSLPGLGRFGKQEEKKTRAKEESRQSDEQDKPVSTQNDLRMFVSRVLNTTRKHKMFCIFPGYVVSDGQEASLVLIVVTQQEVIGVRTYGFYDSIKAAAGDQKWSWKNKKGSGSFDSPYLAVDKDMRILESALKDVGYADAPAEGAIVFTTSGTCISGAAKNKVFTADQFIERLDQLALSESRLINPKECGKALSKLVPRQKK